MIITGMVEIIDLIWWSVCQKRVPLTFNIGTTPNKELGVNVLLVYNNRMITLPLLSTVKNSQKYSGSELDAIISIRAIIPSTLSHTVSDPV